MSSRVQFNVFFYLKLKRAPRNIMCCHQSCTRHSSLPIRSKYCNDCTLYLIVVRLFVCGFDVISTSLATGVLVESNIFE